MEILNGLSVPLSWNYWSRTSRYVRERASRPLTKRSAFWTLLYSVRIMLNVSVDLNDLKAVGVVGVVIVVSIVSVYHKYSRIDWVCSKIPFRYSALLPFHHPAILPFYIPW